MTLCLGSAAAFAVPGRQEMSAARGRERPPVPVKVHAGHAQGPGLEERAPGGGQKDAGHHPSGEPSDMERARAHVMAAIDALRAGDPLRAGRDFEAAYRIVQEPPLLFSAAEAYARAGAVSEALRCYEAYTAACPSCEDRAEAEAKARSLRQSARKGQETPASAEVRKDTTPRDAVRQSDPVRQKAGHPHPESAAQAGAKGPSRLRLAAWITATAAVALAATGGLMTLKAKNIETELGHKMRAVDPQTGEPLPYAEVEPEIRDLKSSGKRYESLSIVFYAAAAAAGIAAGALFTVEHRRAGKEQRPKVRLVPHVAARSAGLVAGIEF